MFTPRETDLDVSLYPMPDGHAGIENTIAVMRKLVNDYRTHPLIRSTAINLVAMTPEKQWPYEVRAVFDFVRDNIRYVNDIVDTETLATPDKTLALRAGDCDDQVVLLASLLESIGYATQFMVGGYESRGISDHVYMMVMLPDGQMMALDPTENFAAGWEPPTPLTLYEEI